VHRRLRPYCGLPGTDHSTWPSRSSPGSLQRVSVRAQVSDHAGSPCTCDDAHGRFAFRDCERVGTREDVIFRGSILGPRIPQPTLHERPRGRPCTARGQYGSLLLYRNGLSPSTLRWFCRRTTEITHTPQAAGINGGLGSLASCCGWGRFLYRRPGGVYVTDSNWRNSPCSAHRLASVPLYARGTQRRRRPTCARVSSRSASLNASSTLYHENSLLSSATTMFNSHWIRFRLSDRWLSVPTIVAGSNHRPRYGGCQQTAIGQGSATLDSIREQIVSRLKAPWRYRRLGASLHYDTQ